MLNTACIEKHATNMQVKSPCQTWNVKCSALAFPVLAACLFHLRVVKGERYVAQFAALREQAW